MQIRFEVEGRTGSVHKIDLDLAHAKTIYDAGFRGVYDALVAIRDFCDRRDRRTHPDGACDTKGLWYPTESENCDHYIDSVEPPTPADPWTYYKAAIDLEHCARIARANYEVVLALRVGDCDGTENEREFWTGFIAALKQARRSMAANPGVASSAS